MTCRLKIIKSFLMEIKNGCLGRYGRHFENVFFSSSNEPKGQLACNLLEIIRVTCRSEIAKIIPNGNPRWFVSSSSEPKGQMTRNLEGIIRVTCR